MKPAVKVQLVGNLKYLKLAAMIANLEACLRQAREVGSDPSEFLLNITEIEVPDGQVKIPHLWPGQNPPATGLT